MNGPCRTHSRPQKPPAPTQWKHHRQPSRRRRQRQNKQRWEPPTASQLEQSSQRDNDKEICFILHLVLFISCTNDCETHWNRFHIKPQSDSVSVSHQHKSIVVPTLSAPEKNIRVALSTHQTTNVTFDPLLSIYHVFNHCNGSTKWNEVSLQKCTNTIFIHRFSQTQLNKHFNLAT